MSALGTAYPIVQQIQKQIGKRLRFVFRNFPLSEMHPHAEAAAEVAEHAAAQDKFREMHDRLFENPERLGDALFLERGEELKLSTTPLLQGLEQRTFEARVPPISRAVSEVESTERQHSSSTGIITMVPLTLKRWFQQFSRAWSRRKAPSLTGNVPISRAPNEQRPRFLLLRDGL